MLINATCNTSIDSCSNNVDLMSGGVLEHIVRDHREVATTPELLFTAAGNDRGPSWTCLSYRDLHCECKKPRGSELLSCREA